jgi:predicted secreted Zn-dependent protease
MAVFLSGSGFAAESDYAREQTGSDADHKKNNNVVGPAINEKYEYYEVCGCSEKDLHCDLMDKAIKCSDGKKYDSVTNWKVKWDYDFNRVGGACSTAAFRVTVDVVFRLPKWVSNTDAPQQLVDKWNNHIKNLLLHEKGHRDRAVEAARELTRTIAELPPGRTCSELDREVDRVSRALLNKLLADQEEYDAATSHGLAQGVSFP